jgi:flagellar basal-body rod modification protein FlgD
MSTVSSTTSASTIQADYIKLLVEQLKNQNPMDPLDNNQMASQLAQFSQLQQLETMNNSFAGVLTTNKLMYASSLIGKNASFLYQTEDGNTGISTGTVQQAYKDNDGNIILSIDGYAVGLDDVVSVQ